MAYNKLGRYILIVFLWLRPAVQSDAQTFTLPQMVEAWKVADTSQSHRAAVFDDYFTFNKDTAGFEKLVAELSVFLKTNKDPRIEVRAILFEAGGARNHRMRDAALFNRYIPLVQKAMHTATALQDDQLIADVYVVYGLLNRSSDYAYLLYNLKALSIHEKIGFEHFNVIHKRLFDMSSTLHNTLDFRQSVNYGLRFFEFAKKEGATVPSCMFQLDMLGSAYRKLGMYDSAAYYYQKLADTAETIEDDPWSRLWVGIGRGNVGYTIALQGKYEEALSLIAYYVKYADEFGEPQNRGLSQNMLADLYFRWGKFDKALSAWLRAYGFSMDAQDRVTAMEIAQGLAKLYQRTGDADNVFYYNEQYHVHRDTLAARNEKNRLATISARVAYDELEQSLSKANQAVSHAYGRRYALIIGIGLAVGLGGLFLYFYGKKTKRNLNQMEETLATTTREATNTRKQADEQNALILELQQTLSGYRQNMSLAGISEKLSRYSLATDTDWEQFRSEFTGSCPGFMPKLYARIPKPTAADERLAILICLGLNNTQIAAMLGISADSVSRSKRRLKQKLGLPEEIKLDEYLIDYFGLLTA